MDAEVKQLLLQSIIHENDTKIIETFDNYEIVLDESFFDYELLKAALRKKRSNIIKFLINKGCRVRSPKINLEETPALHLGMKLLDHTIILTMLNKDINIIYNKNLDGETPLHAAFKEKNYQAVSTVLDYISNCNLCFNPNNKDDILHFHIACIRKHMSSVKLYLSLGFDINSHLSIDSAKYSGLTPLLYLLSQDDYDNSGHLFNDNTVEFVQVFINSGVDVNSSIPFNSKKFAGFTPLHFAVKNVSLELVKLLLKNGADCNRSDKKGKTPLHVACKNFECDEALDIIKILIDYSACPVAADKSGNSPIHLTFCRILHHSSNEANILNRLISKQPLKDNLTDKHGLSFFHIVCTRNEPDLVNHFLNSGVEIDSCVSGMINFDGYTALHFAVHFNQKAVVEVLLKRNASVNIATPLDLDTPLHVACEFSRLKFFEVYCECENAILNHQPRRNINVDWIANRTNHLDIVKLLLLYGADLEAKYGASDFTPLFTLCFVDKDAVSLYPNFFINFSINEINVRLIEITNILLSNKANINCNNRDQWSIFHILSVNDLPRITDELMESLITAGADINAVDKDGQTPLHLAAAWSKECLVQIFLKYKAKINVKSEKSETPLEMAISSYQSHENSVDAEEDDEDIDLLECSRNCIVTLLKNGSDVNIKTKNDSSLLHIAVSCSSPFVIEQLLYYGADINAEDSLGNTAVCALFTNIAENRMNILCVIFMHVQKLLALRLYVSDKVKYFCMHLHQYCKTTLAESIYNRTLDNALDECINELNRMKMKKIDNYTTLYNVLLRDVHELSKYARNQSYIDPLEREDIDKEFPLYGYLLKLQYKKSLLRSDVLKSAKESLMGATNTNLPDMCYDSVLRYLTNEEIVNLKVAVGVTKRVTSKRKLNVFDLSDTEETIKQQKNV